MDRCRRVVGVAVLGFLLVGALPLSAASLSEALTAVRAVGKEGQGNPEASQAWPTLAAAEPEALPRLLAGMDGANDYTINWLRAAVEAVTQRAKSGGQTLPLAALESFLQDKSHHPRARRLAFELIRDADPARADRLIPSFADDPSNELRREAVQLQMTRAAASVSSDKSGGVALYRQALAQARDVDQIDAIAAQLVELKETVDLRETFGWITRWRVVGPFDNTGGVGFGTVFPPEHSLDFDAEYAGKSGPVRWQEYETRDDYGLVDFNKPLQALKGVTGYAYAEFWSDSDRPAEVRLGSKNGWKVWVNGAFLFGRDEYHRAREIDQYRLPIQLKAGRNVLLVKCLQNEQTEDWTVEWEFQLRLTDAQGTPLRSTR